MYILLTPCIHYAYRPIIQSDQWTDGEKIGWSALWKRTIGQLHGVSQHWSAVGPTNFCHTRFYAHFQCAKPLFSSPQETSLVNA